MLRVYFIRRAVRSISLCEIRPANKDWISQVCCLNLMRFMPMLNLFIDSDVFVKNMGMNRFEIYHVRMWSDCIFFWWAWEALKGILVWVGVWVDVWNIFIYLILVIVCLLSRVILWFRYKKKALEYPKPFGGYWRCRVMRDFWSFQRLYLVVQYFRVQRSVQTFWRWCRRLDGRRLHRLRGCYS